MKKLMMLLLPIILIATPFIVSVPAKAETTCNLSNYAKYDLRRNGNNRPDIGQIRLSRATTTNNTSVWCAATQLGYNGVNRGAFVLIKLGIKKIGSTSVVYKVQDSGYYNEYAGWIKLEPPKGYCLGVYGQVQVEGKLFSRTLNNDNFCNY